MNIFQELLKLFKKFAVLVDGRSYNAKEVTNSLLEQFFIRKFSKEEMVLYENYASA